VLPLPAIWREPGGANQNIAIDVRKAFEGTLEGRWKQINGRPPSVAGVLLAGS